MPGVTRYNQKTLKLYEVEVGSLKALFRHNLPLVVFNGTEFFVTDSPPTDRVAAQIAGYLTSQESKGLYEARIYKTVSQAFLNQMVK